MSSFGSPWGWDDPGDEDQFWDENPYSDTLSIWKPYDPAPQFTPTIDERAAYRDALGSMAATLSRQNLGGGGEAGAWAFAQGPSGFGAACSPAKLGWTKWGGYEPRARVGLSIWGQDQLDEPFPVLGGAIVTPTIDIYTRERQQRFDDYGRALDSNEYRTSSGLSSGRATVGEIMRLAGERGRTMLDDLTQQGVPFEEARMQAERAARDAVRKQTSGFPREDFGERWSWPYGLREAMKSAANIRLHGDYGVGPRELFGELGKYGYFTRSTSPSEDEFHPERGAWEAYSLDSLYALGWFKSADGGFITGTSKPDKRRQLGVQRLAMPAGAEALMRTGRLTGDRMLNTTAVFLENYPYSEGSGVVDPALVQGFTDFRPRTVERPTRANEDWKVRFGITDKPGPRGAAGEDVFLGEQFIDGEWRSLEPVRGIPGVQQRLFGWRETTSGYQALIERTFPFESGTTKLMHHGMKALLFQSAPIIERMQRTVASAQAAGVLPADVEAPRMVLPMSKDWLQTYRGMFDFLPEETLRGMGVSDEAIKSKDWQQVGPGVVDKLHQYAQERRFSFQQQHEVPVSRLGAFENAGNIVGGKNAVEYLTKGGEQYARFTAEHTGYALPIAAGFRMEYPGRAPMYSPEELMQLQRMYPKLAERLARGNPASRIWGTAVAAVEGAVPEGVVSHEALPWVSARMNVEGSFDDEGTARTLVENLAREMKERKQFGSIMAPGGVLLPNPGDVLSQSIMGYSGQEQSRFVSSYVQAMKLLGTGGDATEALKQFSETLQTFASGHNVRREALGARLDRAVEGTFTAHMSLPDDVVVAGNDSLRTLLGIRGDDEHGDAKFAEAVRMIEGGENFYALGTRRPVSDMFNQLGVPTRVITEKMANEIYGAEIENLGRSYAVSPTLAAVWRGDVDADRALLHGVTDVRYKGTTVDMPGGQETWYQGGVSFNTSDEILGAHGEQTMMARQVAALRTRAPGAFNEWVAKQSTKTQSLVEAGLQGNRGLDATRALSRALHGTPIDWNESAKWSEELAVGTGKNLPQPFSYYADPANKTVFTREQMLGKFEQTAKSKMLMGRGYNRYLRGLTSMAGSEDELQAAVTLASNIYQKALDNQKMTSGELALFNMMESIGATGAMFDKFDKEQGFVSSAFAGGSAGMVAMLASAITDIDAPPETLGALFSRDPKIAGAAASGNALKIIQAITGGDSEVAAAKAFLEDPTRAGILPQLVQAMHFSKDSMKDVNLNQAQAAYAAQGQRIRSMTRIVSRAGEGGLAPGAAAADMRNMAGLDSSGWWKQMAARRMGFEEQYFASDDEVHKMLRAMGVPDFDNPQTADNDEHMLAIVNKSEAELMQYLRKVPKSQWPEIMAEWRSKQEPSGAAAPEPGSAATFASGPTPAAAPDLEPSASGSSIEDATGRMIAHQVYENFGGRSAFEAAIESIRMFKRNRPEGGPLIPQDRLPRRAVNEIVQRGGGQAGMLEWQKIMGQFGVGFTPRMEDSPDGPQEVWSHSYGSMPAGGAGPVFNMPEGILSEEQIDQLRSSISRALSGAEIDPQTFVGGIASNFMKVLQERGEFDTQSVVPLMPIFQQLLGYGDEMEIWQRMYGPQNMQTRIKLQPQGLKGNAKELLMDMVGKGLTQGYTPEVMGMMEQGYKHSGIGQGMVRSVRDIIDTNVEGLDMKGAWSMWEDVQKVKGALGEDAPEALLDKMGQLNETMARLTEVETQRVEQSRAQLESDPRYQQGMEWAKGIAGSWQQGEALSPDTLKRLKALRTIQGNAGESTAYIDDLLQKNEQDSLFEMAGFGAQGRPGRAGGMINKLLGRGPGSPEIGAGAIENMFTELTLGWTAFRARMAWNLATGAQRGWMNDFMGEENAAVGAALAGGAPAGAAGVSSRYLSANAAMTNAKAQLGEGVAQVYAPFMDAIAGLGTKPGLGAAATLFGTPMGVGSVLAMGTQMVGKGIESAALTGAAGPVGIVGAALTGAALTSAYIAGEAPEWVRYQEGTKEANWRERARVAELQARNEPGIVRGSARIAGALEGWFANTLGLAPTTGYANDPRTLELLQKEQEAWKPGSLGYDADKLRGWAQSEFGNRVPVENALQMAGSLFQITGRTAQEVYEGKAPEFEALMDRYVAFMEGGASPESLFTSQTQTVGYAGVPLGRQSEAWMLQFAQNVPGQQRQMYEQAYKALSAVPSTLGRQTAFGEATDVVGLTEKYGSIERAASQVLGRAGVGWFTSAFGVEYGRGTAQMLGAMFGSKDLPAQDTAQRLAGMTASSFARAGVPAGAAGAFISNLAETARDNVLGMSNLVIQAESVSLQTGQNILSLVNQADAAGYSGKSIAEQRWYLASQGGVSGLAPSAFVPTGQQAQKFEQVFEDLPVAQQAAYKTASGMLSQVMPMGFSVQQLSGFGQMLLGGMSIPELGLGLSAMTGRAGLATSMGIPAASPMAQILEASTIGLPGNLKMTQDQVRGLSGMLSLGAFQYMTGKQIAGMGRGLSGMFMDVWAGDMSAFDFGRGVEVATGSTPWGYSAQRGFGPGSLTDELGRQYGMYEPWVATAGRQAGQSFAPLFDLQMNAAYASLGAQAAALPIEHRQFERQQAYNRLQWGTGSFVPTGAVMQVMNKQYQQITPDMSAAETKLAQNVNAAVDSGQTIGQGMQIGDSSIGLVQQEAAIRKQMWQENLAYQLQSIQFQRQALEISKQELALSKEQYQAQREYNLGERGANRAMQLRQREWSAEDFSIRVERMGITQGWTMEDLQRSRRYATGRERVDIERQIQRTMVSQSWERDDVNRGRSREQEVQRFQDQRYEAAVQFEQRLHALQMQRFELQEQKLNLQGEMLAAQEAHLLAQAGLQEKLQKIDEDRFQFQYEQMQAQMKDDETLEKLRQDARKAELAYQAAQLANAETLKKAQEDWMRELQGIKDGGVLDKWIEFFNSVRAGPPEGKASGGPVNSRTPYLVGERGPELFVPQHAGTIIPNHELGIAQDLRAAQGGQPVIVNFVLDGEVVFSAVVKPERLRPVVEEINRRGKLR